MTPNTPWIGRTSALSFPPIADVNRLAAEAEAAGVDVISLGQALLGLPPPETALAAVRRYLDAGGSHGYSPDPGLPRCARPSPTTCAGASASPGPRPRRSW